MAIASSAVLTLVVLEARVTVVFGDQPLSFDWGAVIGLCLAVLSAFGAWFAWATNRYRWLWGP